MEVEAPLWWTTAMTANVGIACHLESGGWIESDVCQSEKCVLRKQSAQAHGSNGTWFKRRGVHWFGGKGETRG